jgi:STAS-like domain of unknown function (DUF4325)
MDVYPYKLCGDDIPFRDAGQKVRKLIEAHWASGEIFVIRFEGRSVDSVSFFDEAFALLLKKEVSISDLQSRIRFPDIQESDRFLLNFAIAKRRQELDKA